MGGKTPISQRLFDIHYSIRRYYVDEFLARQVSSLPCGALVLDLGGKRARRRGRFNIDAHGLLVECANE